MTSDGGVSGGDLLALDGIVSCCDDGMTGQAPSVTAMRAVFCEQLVEGLSCCERSDSFYCTVALTSRQTDEYDYDYLSREERSRFDRSCSHFVSADLSRTQVSPKNVLKLVARVPAISLQRLHLANWDCGTLQQLPESLLILVMSSKAMSDHAAQIVTQRCPRLESLTVHNTSKLTDAGYRSILGKLRKLRTLAVCADHDLPSGVANDGVLERAGAAQILLTFEVSQSVLDAVSAAATSAAAALITKCRAAFHARVTVAELKQAFERAWPEVEADLAKSTAAIPAVACNHAAAAASITSSFWSYLLRHLDLTTILLMRRASKLPEFCASHSRQPWLTHECTIRFPRPQCVTPDEWWASRLATGVVRHVLSKEGPKWIRHAPVIAWLCEGARALDLSGIAMRDSDIGALVKCFPQLCVLVLTGSPALTNSGLQQLVPSTGLRYLRISGAPQLTPSLLDAVRRNGVVVEYESVTKDIQAKLEAATASLCGALASDLSPTKRASAHLVTSAGDAFWTYVDKFCEGLKADMEVIRSVKHLLLQRCAQKIDTLQLEIVCEALLRRASVAGGSPKDTEDEMWISHLAALIDAAVAANPPQEHDSGDSRDAILQRAPVTHSPESPSRRYSAASGSVALSFGRSAMAPEAQAAPVTGACSLAPCPTAPVLPVPTVKIVPALVPTTSASPFASMSSPLEFANSSLSPSSAAGFPVVPVACAVSPALQAGSISPAPMDNGISSTPPPVSQTPRLHQGFVGLTPRQQALVFVFCHCGVLKRPAETKGASPPPTPSCAAVPSEEVLATLWQRCGQDLLYIVREKFNEQLVGPLQEAFAAISSDSAEAVRNELRTALSESKYGKKKLTTDTVVNCLVKAHLYSPVRHSLKEVINLCMRLRSMTSAAVSYFHEGAHPANRIFSRDLLDAPSVLRLWELVGLTCLAGYFGSQVNYTGSDPIVICLLRDVALNWLVGEDPLLLSHAETEGSSIGSLLTEDDKQLLWDSSLQSLEPQYCTSSVQGLLSLEDRWRPFSLNRFKPERPHALPSRDYMVSRVLSSLIKSATLATSSKRGLDISSWNLWEKTFWDVSHKTLLTMLEFSESETNEKLLASLDFLESQECAALVRLNLQGTRTGSAEIHRLPKGIKALALSDCLLHDGNIVELAERCSALQHLVLSNCDELTDSSVAVLHERLPALYLVDLSGAVLLSDKALEQLRNRGKVHVRYTRYTSQISDKLAADYRSVDHQYSEALHAMVAAKDCPELLDCDSREKVLSVFGQQAGDLLFRCVSDSLLQHKLPEALHTSMLKKSLHLAVAGLEPFEALFHETSCPMEDSVTEEHWSKIFEALPAPSCGVAEKPKRGSEEVSWKQHTLEHYLSLHTFSSSSAGLASLPPVKRLMWALSRKFITTLDLGHVLHPELVSDLLRDLQSRGLTLRVLTVSSVAASAGIRIGFPGPVVSKLVIHGNMLADRENETLAEAVKKHGIELEYENLRDKGLAEVPRNTRLTDGSLCIDRNSWGIASEFATGVRRQLLVSTRHSINSIHLPQCIFDGLFLVVKNFLKDVDSYLRRCGIESPSSPEGLQFLCSCINWLDVSQIVLLEYCGVMLRLSQRQNDAVWEALFRAHHLEPPPTGPAGPVPLREYVIGEVVSAILKEDPFDIVAALITHCCKKLYRLSIQGVDPLPQIECEVEEIVLGSSGEPGNQISSYTVLGLPGALHAPNAQALRSIRLTMVEDLTNDDVLQVVSSFANLVTLEVVGCPRIAAAPLTAKLAESCHGIKNVVVSPSAP